MMPYHSPSVHTAASTPPTTTVAATSAAAAEVSIYWDYENLALPRGVKPSDASKAIVEAATPFGRIVDRRLYFDMSSRNQGVIGSSNNNSSNNHNSNWSVLDSSGFDLVNTPRRNQKETTDKKMIADVFTFAWDSAVRNRHSKPVVILLTSDGDFAYTLSKLRDRGVLSVVMYGNDSAVADVLKQSADIALSFEADVLGAANKKRLQLASAAAANNSGAIVPRGLSFSGDDSAYNDALSICRVVVKELSKEPNEEWLLGSKLAVAFHTTLSSRGAANYTGEDAKDRYRRARDLAIKKGWVVKGRHSLVGKDKGEIVIVPSNASGNNPNLYSKVDFYRLTVLGKMELEEATTKKSIGGTGGSGGNTRLFVKNLPIHLRIHDIVQYLEQEHNVVVLRGNTLKSPAKTSFMFARLEMLTEQDADKVVALAESSKLKLGGRVWEVNYDRAEKKSYYVDPEHRYERANTIDYVSSLCKILHTETARYGIENGWVECGRVAPGFRSFLFENGFGAETNSDKYKELFKTARSDAIAKNYIELGRRVNLSDRSGNVEVVTPDSDSNRYTLELYVRLTESGRQVAQQPRTPFGVRNSSLANAIANKPVGLLNVFIKGLPKDTHVQELVKWIETSHDCQVKRASIDPGKPWSTSCNAHVEFSSVHDAARILKYGSNSDGLEFQGRSLAAVADERVPTAFPGNDPSRFYECESPLHDSIPSTVSTTGNSVGASSLGSQKSLGGSQPSADDVLFECDDVSLFCRVLYDLPYGAGDCESEEALFTQWKHTGSASEDFQKLLKCMSTDESKARFKKVRADAIADGVIEMGRRELKTENKDVVVVPFFSDGKTNSSFSLETYLRLTKKGLALAETVPATRGSNTFQSKLTDTTGINIYVSNLPRTTEIHDLCDFLEDTFTVNIQRACLNIARPNYSYTSAHIECKDGKDCKKILTAVKSSGLVYGGRALRVRADNHIPVWTNRHPDSIYEKNSSGDAEEEGKADGDGILDFAKQHKGKGNSTSASSPTTFTTLESNSTDLLFFEDCPALEREQLAPMTPDKSYEMDATALTAGQEVNDNDIDIKDSGENMSMTVSVYEGSDNPMDNDMTAVAPTTQQAPDLLWD